MLVFAHHPPGPTTFVTKKALPTEADGKIPPKTLQLHLFSRIAEMRHTTDKRTVVAQQRYKQYHDAQLREETCFRDGQPFYMDHPTLSTCTADKLPVQDYSKLLCRHLDLITSVDDIAHHHVRQGRNFEYNLRRPGIAGTLHVQLNDDTAHDKHN